MKKKLSFATLLAMVLTLAMRSLAFAAVQPAPVTFMTDTPCAVSVLVFSYTDPITLTVKSTSGFWLCVMMWGCWRKSTT